MGRPSAPRERSWTSQDLFEFWEGVGGDLRIHPADAEVMARVEDWVQVQQDCLPIPFTGPLRTAPVVLLYLNPGFRAFDQRHATSEEGQRWHVLVRGGGHPLPTEAEHPDAWAWRVKMLRGLGLEDYEVVRSEVAILNLTCYRSKSFHDWPLLSTLPSSRVVQAWAQSHLFPQAQRGERLVVCMRSTRWWGLDSGEEGHRYGEALYAPRVTRSGFLRKGAMRDEVIAAVRRRLGAA